MSDDLAEIKDRLDGLDEDIDRLQPNIFTFLEGLVEYQRLPSEHGYTTYARATKGIPNRLRQRIGMLVSEQRACLDALACVLALRASGNDDNTYFPISKTEEIFRDDGLKRKLRKVSEADKNKIAALKPWKGGDDRLFAIHSLDLLRKHRRLPMHAVSIPRFELNSVKSDYLDFHGPQEIKTRWTTLFEMDANAEVHIRIANCLAFKEPQVVAHTNVQDVLQGGSHLIRSIVAQFN